jgi:hypothetical protein
MNNDDDIGIQQWARDAYANGAREEDKADQAKQFIEWALDLNDPASALMEPVAAHMGTLLHRLAVAQERDAGLWREAPGAGRTGISAGKARQRTRKQQQQLEECKWVPGKGRTPWRDITVADIDATIAFYRKSIDGIERSIQQWQSARALMVKHRAETLGDVPGFRLQDLPQDELQTWPACHSVSETQMRSAGWSPNPTNVTRPPRQTRNPSPTRGRVTNQN